MRSFIIFIMALAGITQLSAEQRTDKILIQGNPAGTQTVQIEPRAVRVEYSYNDRGRGDHIIATWKLDADGVPIEYEGRGNDYMKAPVEEQLRNKERQSELEKSQRKRRSGRDGQSVLSPAQCAAGIHWRARARPAESARPQTALLPAGEASIEEAGKRQGTARKAELTQYRITGLSFTPQSIWLDREGNRGVGLVLVFRCARWFEAAIPQLLKAQKSDCRLVRRISRAVAHIPKGDLVIRNARLFDPRDLSVTPGTSVLVRGDRIVRVGPDADIKPSADAEIIDAHGRFLMPGLWDNHQHLADSEGPLDLANGVTSARDMANDTDTFLQRVARYDDGTELGPRVLKAGIIDGTGEFAGPTKMRVDTAEQAIEDVDWHADHGYVQIKIYSSIKPELVPIIADRAHARGMRVSGHVPAFMSARQFVENGADEIQHFNFIELNFLFPEVKETRNRDRFIKVAEHAREFTPDKPAVREFIKFLKEHHTVLDPTMSAFEGLFCGDPSAVTPGLEDIVPRFPPQIRRVMRSGALEVPADKAAAYREAFPAMLRLLKALYDAGITIIPGTDALAGYMLHHELELYVRAGIPGRSLAHGHAHPGSSDGCEQRPRRHRRRKTSRHGPHRRRPAQNIRDIRNITTVIKGGKIYDPAAIEKALGITPRHAVQSPSE